MAFSPCFEKSLSSAQITASLSLLREPRSRPAGLPDTPGCQRLVGMCVLAPCLLLCKCMIALSIRQSGREVEEATERDIFFKDAVARQRFSYRMFTRKQRENG